MATAIHRAAPFRVPRVRGNWLLALLAVLALAAAGGFWHWSSRTKVTTLSLGAGVELRYRKPLVGILCEEAAERALKVEIQSSRRAAEAIQRVDCGELDAAVIPAGLAVPGENVRQVAILECEALHLFVKPALMGRSVGGLRGLCFNLGPVGGGVRIIAEEILQFVGMMPGRDYQDAAYSYPELLTLPPDQMPDAVFSLSPLPAPLGEKLAQRYGYQLMELPFGEALAMRKPYLEDTCVPAHTYGVYPAVPDKPLHTVGTRSVLIAHAGVSKVAIRRLLEVLYESDFARRVGMPPLDPKLLHRSGEYPSHAGTIAYLRRQDPWVNQEFIEGLKRLRGMIVSIASAALLAWQWYRRRGVTGADDDLRRCSQIDLDALRASSQRKFDEAKLRSCLAQLAELKMEVLEKHQNCLLAGDQQFADLLARIESLQQTLPGLLRTVGGQAPASLAPPSPQRKAA